MIGTEAKRDHVVDDRRLAEQSRDRRQRRLEAHHAALALEALEHRGLFAADVGAGAEPDLEIERASRCRGRRRRGSRARRRRRWPRFSARRACGILGAQVDVAPRRRRRRAPAIVMPSISTNGSPSIIMRSEKVPESPSSALQTTYFWPAGVSSTVFHLMPVGNAAPPRPRRPGLRSPPRRCRPAPCASARRRPR